MSSFHLPPGQLMVPKGGGIRKDRICFALFLKPNIFLPLLIGWCCLHLTVLAQTGKRMFTLTGGDTRVQLPFTLVNNQVVVAAKLNGMKVNLVLDTGSPSILLMAPEIGRLLEPNATKEVTFTGPGKGQKIMKAKVLSGVRLEMEGIQGPSIALLSTQTRPAFLREISEVPVHGILGYPFFVQFVVTIDYQKRLLTLTEAEGFLPALDAMVFPFSLATAKPIIATSLTVGQHTFWGHLLLDTGGGFDLLLHDALGKRMKGLLNWRSSKNLGAGFGGSIYGTIGEFPHFQLGHLYLSRIRALFPDKKQYFSTESDHSSHDGSVGNGILKHFVVTIDYINQALYLQKPGALPQVPYLTEQKVRRGVSPHLGVNGFATP